MFKRHIILISSTVAVLGLAVGAFAYFTNGGAGTGSATVGTSSPITITASAPTTLYPGTSSDVAITLTNSSTTAHQYVNTVSLNTISTDVSHSSCLTALGAVGTAWFTFANPVSVATDLAPLGVVTVHGTLLFNNLAVVQNACQTAPLTLNLTSN